LKKVGYNGTIILLKMGCTKQPEPSLRQQGRFFLCNSPKSTKEPQVILKTLQVGWSSNQSFVVQPLSSHSLIVFIVYNFA